ncbi:hypothetical protein [Yinghuangia soli]|uniref:Uncharacterized protein n=1 Tax=Yinghuangia soli TaxID=2908204 RepID=A0AA41Q7M5_9ACTN|nr:hypothetical protein [Yinghuangia soli]MCF2532721.1 hypothetical protein [Yinghuangia soli]
MSTPIGPGGTEPITLPGLDLKFTALKKEVEGVKFVAAGAAITGQLLKVDMSLVKIDEKAITFKGRELHRWGWSLDKPSDRDKRKRDNAAAKALPDLAKAEESSLKAAKARSRADAAKTRADMRKLNKEADRLAEKARKQHEKVAEHVRKVSTKTTALDRKVRQQRAETNKLVNWFKSRTKEVENAQKTLDFSLAQFESRLAKLSKQI